MPTGIQDPIRKKIISGMTKLMSDILFHKGSYADLEYTSSYDRLREFIEAESLEYQVQIRERLLEAALVPFTRKVMSSERYQIIQELWNKSREKHFTPMRFETPDLSIKKKQITEILNASFLKCFPEFVLNNKLRKAIGTPQSILFSHEIHQTQLYFEFDCGTWGPGRWSGIIMGTDEPSFSLDLQPYLPIDLAYYVTTQELSNQCEAILPFLRNFSRPVFEMILKIGKKKLDY